ncbi:MAG: YciI family protein [Bradyrhizobium sp.]
MLYAILAYHVEAHVMSWTPQEDAALMADLHRVHDRLTQEDRLGPAVRLGATNKARTLRGPGAGLVVDGPFAETKEQLLGFYVVDCASEDAAIAAARDLRRVNPSAVYEIRPVSLYLPGVPFPVTEAGDEDEQVGEVRSAGG